MEFDGQFQEIGKIYLVRGVIPFYLRALEPNFGIALVYISYPGFQKRDMC